MLSRLLPGYISFAGRLTILAIGVSTRPIRERFFAMRSSICITVSTGRARRASAAAPAVTPAAKTTKTP
jgi:chromosome condensin MukBEF complex kleisin-like MukF subunit